MKSALIIDDTKNICKLLTKYLELEGYAVQCAVNGQEGFELLTRTGFDLVFLDIKLPEMSGTEVLRRANKMGIKTSFIIMTAYPTIKNAVECTKLGAVAYLQKPFTTERLHTLLTDLNVTINSQKKDDNRLYQIQQMLEDHEASQALELIRETIPSHLTEPQIYQLLAKAFDQLGDTKMAEIFSRIIGLFE